MRTPWDIYRRKCYSLLSAISSRKKWDEENIDDINWFEEQLRSTMLLMQKSDEETMSEYWESLQNYWKMEFPPRVHPHHTAEYRRKNYKSVAKYSDEERRLAQSSRCKEFFREWNNNPENKGKRSRYNSLLKPAANDIRKLIEKMTRLDPESEEYKKLDDQLTDYIETHEELKMHIKEGNF